MSKTINNLNKSLKDLGLGLTEEQVQGLINAGLVNVQKFKLTTDEGQGFVISNQDANTCTGSGTIYFGENITNSPACAVGTWWTIENYTTADGKWGHQIATAWHSNEVYIRRKSNGTFDGWRKLVEQAALDNVYEHVGYTQGLINNVQKHKLSDDSGFCQNLSSCNWNNVKTCGYYMGSGTTNAPENSADWFMVHVIAHNQIWCEQIATAFTSTQKRYVRYQLNGSWTAWRSL